MSVRLFFSLLLLCSSAFAAQPWDGAAFAADPDAVRRAVAALPVPPNADVEVLLQEETYRYEPDGRRTSSRRLVYRILTPNGVEVWPSVERSWAPWYQQRPVLRARVINPDGSLHQLDPATIAESPVADESENIYSDARRLRAPLPALVPGSIVEELVTVTDASPLLDAGLVDASYFGFFGVPTLQVRLVLDLPSSLPVQHRTYLLDDLQPQRSAIDGRIVLTFQAGPLPALEVPEAQRPGDLFALPQVRFSTARSWQDVATRYHAIVQEKLTGADLSAYIAKPRAQHKDRRALIQALIDQLHRDVRYTGVEFGDASIVPRAPAQVLKTRYGDCKDKSTLLIAMLRAAGIPAYLALLRSGYNTDLSTDLPGFGMFDHAVVYVPGEPDLWIDATAELSRIYALPPTVQGRRALVARAETTALLTIPELPSHADSIVEHREYLLPENGPAKVIEVTEPHGYAEAEYRSWYRGVETKSVRQQLEEYVANAYMAERLGRLHHTPGADMSTPFRLTIEAEKARRGYVTENDATLYIPAGNIYSRLPDFIRNAPEAPADSKAVQESRRRKHPAVLRNFVTEWRIRVVPPPGFTARALRPASSLNFGPAVLTREFRLAPDGAVLATYRFDTVRSHWTAAEVEDARKAIREFELGDSDTVRFDLTAALLLQQDRVREAMAEYQKLIALHPKEALHREQLAAGLLAAGFGEAAQQELRQATQLEPASARTWSNLAWALQFNAIGRRMEKGWDPLAAGAAYEKAIKLDPDFPGAVLDYAVLMEHGLDGEKYSDHERLVRAIQLYQSVGDKLEGFGRYENLVFALFYAGRFADLRAELRERPLTDTRRQLLVAAAAALDGSSAALDEAGRLTSDQQQRTALLRQAADLLLRTRRYPLAADLLVEAARAQSDPASLLATANFLRQAVPFDQALLPESDPRRVLQQLVISTLGSSDVTFESLLEPHVVPPGGLSKRERESFDQVRVRTLRSLDRNALPRPVILDLGLGNIQFTPDGDPALGYRLHMQALGVGEHVYYVAPHGAGFRVVAGSDDVTGIGAYALWRIQQGDLAGARRWLDWAREELKPAGGDDPLAGPLLPRFWTRGNEASPETMTLAAASMLVATDHAKTVLPLLLRARDTAPSQQHLALDLALAATYLQLKDYPPAYAAARRLLAAAPDSLQALTMLTVAAIATDQTAEAESRLQARLQRMPNDPDSLRLLTQLAASRKEFQQAAAYARRLIDAGRASPRDVNSYAWNLLLAGAADASVEPHLQRAIQANRTHAPLLHTAAAVYAENGRTREARELLLETLDASGLEEPNGHCWYLVGRLAEQYGLREVALAAYDRVNAPEEAWLARMDSYALAQQRLASLRVARKTQTAGSKR